MILNPVQHKKSGPGGAVNTLVVLNDRSHFNNGDIWVLYDKTGKIGDEYHDYTDAEVIYPDVEVPFTPTGVVTIPVEDLYDYLYESDSTDLFINISIEGNKLMVKLRSIKV